MQWVYDSSDQQVNAEHQKTEHKIPRRRENSCSVDPVALEPHLQQNPITIYLDTGT